jgi:hypothetical protein
VSGDDVKTLIGVNGVALLATLLLLPSEDTHRCAALMILHKCCIVCCIIALIGHLQATYGNKAAKYEYMCVLISLEHVIFIFLILFLFIYVLIIDM